MEVFIGLGVFLVVCLVIVGIIAHKDKEKYNGYAYNDPAWMEGVDLEKNKS